jgi:hypothetical protein
MPQLKSQYHKFNNAKPNLKELQLLMFNPHYKEFMNFLKENILDYHPLTKYKTPRKTNEKYTYFGETWIKYLTNSYSHNLFYKYSSSSEYRTFSYSDLHSKYER